MMTPLIRTLVPRFTFWACAAATVAVPAAEAAKCPNVQILIDRSGSMDTALTGTTTSRLTAAKGEAIRAATTLADQAQMGVSIFPDAGACGPGLLLRPKYDQSMEFAAKLQSVGTQGSSASGSAVEVTQTLTELNDPTRKQYLILITDGVPSCSTMGPPNTDAGATMMIAAAKARTPSIGTFVVGVGTPMGTDKTALVNMANAGGYAAPTTSFYPAESLAQFKSTMDTVLNRIELENFGCDDSGSPPDGGPPVEDMTRPKPDFAVPPDMAKPLGKPPVIDWVLPKQIPAGVPSTVEVTGRNFAAEIPSAQVFLEGGGNLRALADALVTSPGTIRAVIPADMPVGTFDVVVKNPDGQSASLAGGLTLVGQASGCAMGLGPLSGLHMPAFAIGGLTLLGLLGVRRTRTRRERSARGDRRAA